MATTASLFGLAPSHVARLEWFERREGTTSGYPSRLPNGDYLVTRPKGIFKPKDLNYALSIRVNLDSPYDDGHVARLPDGSWQFVYHQEGDDPDGRDAHYTNRGLMACIRDQVPVGVLRQTTSERGRTQYEVLGLGMPVDWWEGYFLIAEVRADGSVAAASWPESLEVAAAEKDDSSEASEPAAPPDDDYDARVKTLRAVHARRGQPAFRRALLDAYGGSCALTGTAYEGVLEAAHLKPYRGPESNTVTNGLLLRADLHTLFDLGALGINPETRTVSLIESLRSGTYSTLHGATLREPRKPDWRPSADALEKAWQFHQRAQGAD